MICTACGTDNEPGRKFCGECGTRLAIVCGTCGTPNTPGTKFCGECGGRLGEDASVAQPDIAHVAERRLVSVLFADLVGFTTISESRDSEAVRELLERYFAEASSIVTGYGGLVEKFIGDAVMAVWGTPTAHEDDAERAVRTALDLVAAAGRIGSDVGAELSLRAGVMTGEAAVTLGATNQGMVAGDLVNTASRLQSVADPGTVVVGEETFRAASRAIAFEPVGELALKGKAIEVPAYRALRVVAQRGGAGRSEQLEAPFVGRSAELRMLKDFHTATGAERRPRLVSIMGQAGIGKSRLIWEYQKYIDGVTDVVYWHRGRSPAYGEGVSFWALAEMVRSRAGLAQGADAATTRSAINATVEEFVPDPAERAWLVPRLLELVGAGDKSELDSESLFAAWRTFFERIAERGTVVLVFEDLHWADSGLLDFIEHVLDWSRDRPIFIITAARPELLDRRETWGGGRRSFTSLVLDPLSTAEMRDLLNGLVPGLPDSLVSRIVERAEGIPLFAMETVRVLLSEGQIEERDGAYRLLHDVTELSVAPSLRALVASRLDALETTDHRLLEAASVIGKTFSAEALAAVAGEEMETIVPRLRDLVRRELLSLDADPMSAERGQFGFLQSIMREVAYATLSRRDRRALHLAAARHFETLDDDALAGVLAEHYLAAFRTQPEGAEGEAVAAQARLATRAAADRAKSLGSYQQAASYYKLALEVTQDQLEQADLHEQISRSLGIASTDLDQAVEHAQRAVALVRPLGERRRTLQALTALLAAQRLNRRVAESVEIAEATAAEFGDLEGSIEYVRFAVATAGSYMLLTRDEDALEVIASALPSAERLGLTNESLDLLAVRGALIARMGRINEATALLAGVIEVAASHNFMGIELRARINLSYASAADDAHLAHRVARDGLAKARRFGRRGQGEYLRGNAVGTAIEIGEWDWAVAELDDYLDETAISGWVDRGTLAALRGEPAEQYLAQAERILEGSSEVQRRAVYDQAFAMMAFAQRRLQEARDFAVSAFTADRTPDAQSVMLAVRATLLLHDADGAKRVAAELAGRAGRMVAAYRLEAEAGIAALEGSADALGRYVESIRLWGDMDVPFETAQAGLVALSLLGTTQPGIIEAGHRSREIFARLGAVPFVEWIDELLAAAPAATEPVAEGVRIGV